MSQQSDKAKWDALAEILGAQVSQPESPPKPRAEPKAAPRVHLDLPPPPRKKADWESLAVDLGAEVKHRPEHVVVSPPHEVAAPEARETRPSSGRATGQPRRERAQGEEARERDETVPKPAARHAVRETPPDALPSADVSAPSTLDSEGRPPRRRRRRGTRQREDGSPRPPRRESEPDVTEPSDEFEEPLESEEPERREPGGGGKRAGHKSVPSWAEAISIMIDGNLATRSTRRRTGPNGGRTRGRRGSRRA